MDAIDVAIIDQSSALRVQLCPLRFSTCNLHGLQTKQGITALVNSVLVQQFINSNFPLSRADIEPAHHSDIWIESGCVQFGPVYIEGNFHPPTPPPLFCAVGLTWLCLSLCLFSSTAHARKKYSWVLKISFAQSFRIFISHWKYHSKSATTYLYHNILQTTCNRNVPFVSRPWHIRKCCFCLSLV